MNEALVDALNLDAAAAFLAALTNDDGWTTPVVFQTFDDRPEKRPTLARVFAGPFQAYAAQLRRLNREGACVAVAINALRGQRRLASAVTALRALFIDCDHEPACPLAVEPSVSVHSKSGPHHYWLLQPGEPVALFAAAQRQLAAYYGADPLVCDPSRVMRLPGFLHQKGEPFLVQLTEADPTRRYALRDILHPHARAVAGAPPSHRRRAPGHRRPRPYALSGAGPLPRRRSRARGTSRPSSWPQKASKPVFRKGWSRPRCGPTAIAPAFRPRQRRSSDPRDAVPGADRRGSTVFDRGTRPLHTL